MIGSRQQRIREAGAEGWRRGRTIWTAALLALTALTAASPTHAQVGAVETGPTRMSPELLWELGRVGDASFSPDGRFVVYSVRRYDITQNKGDSDLYAYDLQAKETVHVTPGPGSESDVQWVATASGWRLFYVLKAEGAAHAQVWSFSPDSGEARVVSDYDFDISNLKVDPTARRIAFTRSVELDPRPVQRYPDLPKAEARIIDSLLYRHWDQWSDYSYSHLFVADLSSDLEAREPTDLMEGLRWHCPTPPFGGAEEFAWSPDGEEIAFTMKVSNRPAESTDTDVWIHRIGSSEGSVCLTTGMDGYDKNPLYSPDGRWLAFQSMEHAGYESDRDRIFLFDRQQGGLREWTEGMTDNAHIAKWAADSQSMLYSAECLGTDQVFRITLGSEITALTSGPHNWALKDVSPADGCLLLARQDMIRPWELGLQFEGGPFEAITDVNGEIYSTLELPTVEERFVTATDGASIHNWVIYPPNFDPSRRYPVLVYCQGGPQSQVSQFFSYRWNFHLMAAAGYVVVAPNRRGLPGFGQDWNAAISKDWGGQAMQDILSCTDSMLAEPYADSARFAAIGASFGGYTVYWLMGNSEGRFCSMVAHCGLFDLPAWYGSTEELFFANWDLGGAYWSSPEIRAVYEKFSPHNYVQNWRTPLLVFHGERDYRVPVTQGMEAFTAAQLQGLKSRFVYFPDEGHWVLGPQNGLLWHREFFRWLDETCAPVAGG